MRHLIIYLAMVALATLASCEQDNYDKGEGNYSRLTADFVEAHTNDDTMFDYVITDNGDSLCLTIPVETSWAKKPDSLYRAMLYYNKVEGNKAEIVAIGQMSTLGFIPADSVKEMKTDPVGFESAWTSKSKRYINLALTLRVGTVTDQSIKHKLFLIADSLVTKTAADNATTLHLTLYHDKGDIPEYFTQKYYFSIPTSGLKAFNPDSMSIHINTSGNGRRIITMPLE